MYRYRYIGHVDEQHIHIIMVHSHTDTRRHMAEWQLSYGLFEIMFHGRLAWGTYRPWVWSVQGNSCFGVVARLSEMATERSLIKVEVKKKRQK